MQSVACFVAPIATDVKNANGNVYHTPRRLLLQRHCKQSFCVGQHHDQLFRVESAVLNIASPILKRPFFAPNTVARVAVSYWRKMQHLVASFTEDAQKEMYFAEFAPNILVWAKYMKLPYWPCKLVQKNEPRKKGGGDVPSWQISFFGDFTRANKVKESNIKNFCCEDFEELEAKGMKSMATSANCELFEVALQQAFKEYEADITVFFAASKASSMPLAQDAVGISATTASHTVRVEGAEPILADTARPKNLPCSDGGGSPETHKHANIPNQRPGDALSSSSR